MEKLRFTHRVSKGSRFNQIYIPKNMEPHFQTGDLVEVTLLEKSISLYYSKGLLKLSEFKEKLIKEVFFETRKYREIRQTSIVGSFLTRKQDFNDIDIVIILEKDAKKEIENKIYDILTHKFELKFHVISISEDRFETLLKIDPLIISMLYHNISDKKFKTNKAFELDKNHIKYLLMMPEDVLGTKLNPKVYYDSIRRLVTIERFLKNKPVDPIEINNDVKDILGKNLVLNIKNNEHITVKELDKIEQIIKEKLKEINRTLKNE